MSVNYTRINWEDSPSTQTPINAENLNTMDSAIDDLAGAVNEMDGVTEDVEDLQTEIGALKNDLTHTDSIIGEGIYKTAGTINNQINNGAVTGTVGQQVEIGTQTTWKYMAVSCSDGDAFRVKTYMASNTAVTGYVYFVDANGIVLDVQMQPTGTQEYVESIVTAPSGTATMYAKLYVYGSAEMKVTALTLETLTDSVKKAEAEAYSAYVVETATGSIASFPDGADDVPVKDLTVAIEPVQSGSGDPSPTNVRPISGWTGANVTACGVNVWDEEWELGTYNINTGAKEGSNANIRCKNLIPVIPNTAYYLLAAEAHWLIEYDANKNAIKYGAVESQVYTVSGDTHYLAFYMNGTYGTTYNHDISINYPYTDTAYHAYDGSSVSVDWTTEAGTVYGGTLDVTTGGLTVDRGFYTLTGSETWSAWDTHAYYSNCLPSSAVDTNDTVNCISSMMEGKTTEAIYSGTSGVGARSTRLYISATEYANIETFTGMQLCYKLATPQTYQLTPEEVKTILGQNNIFADTGNVTVQYRADTKLYIDKVLFA